MNLVDISYTLSPYRGEIGELYSLILIIYDVFKFLVI